MSKLLQRGLLILVLTLVAGSAFSVHRYPGLTTRLFDHAREATLTESWNLFLCLSYWLEFMEELELDPETGVYEFPADAADRTGGDDACKMRFHLGEFAAAASCLERQIERQGPSEDRLFWLAVSTMRQAEADNCLAPLRSPLRSEGGHSADHDPFGLTKHAHAHSPLYCVLPIGREHERDDLGLRAAEFFERLLDEYDSEDSLYRWLLSFNLMTIGRFPDAVPERYRIETSFIEHFYGAQRDAIRGKYRHLSFRDRANELGVDTHDTGRGVAVEDFDGDGFFDIVTGGAFDTLRYYGNVGGRSFEERTEDGGLAGVTQPFVITSADFDNDGWIDLFVSRPFDHFLLFRNDGDGTFTDVTESSGLLATKESGQIAASWTPAWADVDLDGDLDLFLAQWGMRLPFVSGLLGQPRMNSKLFINQGGKFFDRTEEFGLSDLMHDEYYVGATFGDYDDDGYPDLFVSSPVRLATRLLHNRNGTRFEPVGLVDRTESGFFTSFVDVDHDGKLDIFQGGFGEARTSTAMSVFGEGRSVYKSGHSTILRQNDEGRFEDRIDFFDGGGMAMATMGVSYGDLNNDGCHDFYLGTGNPESWFVLPNLMFIGRPDGPRCSGRMENISMLEGFGTIQKGHSIVFFDFDEDGDQDVYSSLGGMWPFDRWPNQFFVNESSLANSWIKIRLRGRETNHFGVGARIRVAAVASGGGEVVRHFHMDNKTGFGSAPYLAHIGLLDAESIREVEVYWPVSRCRHSYPARLNQLNVLDENACRPTAEDAAAEDVSS